MNTALTAIRMKKLAHRFDATMVFGHDAETLESLMEHSGGIGTAA